MGVTKTLDGLTEELKKQMNKQMIFGSVCLIRLSVSDKLFVLLSVCLCLSRSGYLSVCCLFIWQLDSVCLSDSVDLSIYLSCVCLFIFLFIPLINCLSI